MLKKEAKKDYQREYMKRKRSNIGSNKVDGSNIPVTSGGSNIPVGSNKGLTYPDIMDKLTDPAWRSRLEKICDAFDTSHYPPYARDVRVGVYGPDLATVCELLGITS